MKDVIWTVLFKCVVTSELEIASTKVPKSENELPAGDV